MGVIDYIFQDRKCGGVITGLVRIVRMFFRSRASDVVPLFRLSGCPQIPKILRRLANMRYGVLCDKYNIYMPAETQIGRGVSFPHNFPVVINPQAKIGVGCTIHPCVLIGRNRGKVGAPVIGDNCFIGHGVKIIGSPKIGCWCFLSPGAIVTKDIPDGSLVGVGLNNVLGLKGKMHVELYK